MPTGPTVGTIDVPIPFTDLGGLVKSLFIVALAAAVLFFFIQLIIGGISWISAGGDPKNLESARNRITNAVVGLIIVVAAFAITLIVTTILGVNIFQTGGVDITPPSF